MYNALKIFLPHYSNNHRAHALKTPAIFSYIFLLIILQIFLRVLSVPGSNILGVSTNISATDIINLTNERRISEGIRPVKENLLLSKAAEAKARDMLAQNYWAHFAPDGTTPWQFITQAGYRYSVAGENLARDFDTATAVVVAWMNSPSHKQNLLDNSFTEIGVAVTEGNLNGINGSLIVQMFATPASPAITENEAPTTLTPEQLDQNSSATAASSLGSVAPPQSSEPNGVTGSGSDSRQVSTKYALNPYQITKTVSLAVSGMLVLLISIDIIYIRRNRINKALHHNFAHLFVFGMFAIVIAFISSGAII